MVSIETLKLMNERAIMNENTFVKQAYMYDYLIQINLSSVNGLTLKTNPQINKESIQIKSPIANVFFKFSHKDSDSLFLTNKN
jgi:hypothetical protein